MHETDVGKDVTMLQVVCQVSFIVQLFKGSDRVRETMREMSRVYRLMVAVKVGVYWRKAHLRHRKICADVQVNA